MRPFARALLSAAFSFPAFAAPFTGGNLVVSRIGDGAAALSGNATAVFLDEYTTAGSASGNVIALPTAASGSNYICTLSGTATSVGFLSLSTDGKYISMFGTDAPVATTTPNGNASFTGRTVAVVGYDGSVNTSTRFSQAGTTPRSAVTTNGTDIWTTADTGSGTTGGLRYMTVGSTTGGAQLNSTTTNLRVAKIFNSQLYISTSVGTSPAGKGINSTGGLPTGATTYTVLPGLNTASNNGVNDSPYDFFFADANTLYVADDDATSVASGGLHKYVYNSSTSTWSHVWNALPSGTQGVRALCGSTDALGNVQLYAVTATSSGSNAIVSLADTLAGTTAGTFSTLASSPTNTVFRGITFAPIPEPGCATLLMAGIAVLGRRRK